MRICIPTEDDKGLDSRLCDHFGSAPFFALANTESEDLEMTLNKGHHQGHGHCKPIGHINVDQTDAIVCQGMGKRALASLRKGGVDVLITSAATVRGVISEARAGKLRKLQADKACGGHGAKHRC